MNGSPAPGGSESDPLADFFVESPEKLFDPFADLAWLREHRPVHWQPSLGQWFVFPYEEVRRLFGDARLGADRISGFAAAAPAAVRAEVAELVPYLQSWLIFRDGSAHSQLRNVLHGGFNASVIAAMRPAIARIANELLDRAIISGRLDVAADYGFLLPAYVLSDFMGVHPRDRGRVVQWSVDFVDFFNLIPITEDTTRRMISSTTEMTRHMRELLATGPARGSDEFLGVLAGAAAAGQISQEEILGSTLLLLIAGHVAVRNLIGNVIWLLLEHPAEHARLRAEPALLTSVIEESLRVEPPITAIPRIALQDTEVGGETIRAGQIVQLSIAAANRDPLRFPEPDRFDVGRNPRGVLSFGYGPHGCLGARLAREQARIALEVLWERVGGGQLRLDPGSDTRWYRNAGNRGPENLPVRFD